MTDIVERLRIVPPQGMKPPQIIALWRSERAEAATLIEQQLAVISGLVVLYPKLTSWLLNVDCTDEEDAELVKLEDELSAMITAARTLEDK